MAAGIWKTDDNGQRHFYSGYKRHDYETAMSSFEIQRRYGSFKKICPVCGNKFRSWYGNAEKYCRYQCSDIVVLQKRHEKSANTPKKIKSSSPGNGSQYPRHYELKQVRKKLIDQYGCCQLCGITLEDAGNLETHHLDKDKSNHNISNLIVVCRSCHRSKYHSGPRLQGATP